MVWGLSVFRVQRYLGLGFAEASLEPYLPLFRLGKDDTGAEVTALSHHDHFSSTG